MFYSTASLTTILFAFLLIALIIALIFRRDFRDAVLGSPGEASIMGLLTVKGVAIVLLCGLLIGAIMFTLTKLPSSQQHGPISVRLNVHFEPDDVNPKNPKFRANAFIKTSEGRKPIDIVTKASEGALSVSLKVPDMETPFYIEFETPRGIWQTDDHSIHEAAATARKQEVLTP